MNIAIGFTTVILLFALFEGTTARHLEKRAAEDHEEGHEEESHDHEEDSHDHEDEDCQVTPTSLSMEFSELATNLMFTGEDGKVCHVEMHGHDEDDHDDDHQLNITANASNASSCEETFHFVEQLLLRLNLTTPCCLENGTSCETHEEAHDDDHEDDDKITTAQAYGYGFLMVLLVSAGSLFGLFMLPFINNERFKPYYHYIYALLISLGASALFCDAVLHLIPEAFGLHDHEDEGDGHGHAEDEAEDELKLIWKSSVVVLGLYIFFIFEFILHTCSPHSHSLSSHSSTEHVELEANGSSTHIVGKADQNDVTFPHGKCQSKGNEMSSSILHPKKDDSKDYEKSDLKSCGYGRHLGRYILGIKPLAWLIILGDGLHNFADGLALGAAISESLSLGISTTIALIFHEIPHELGDYVILLSTGMTWYAALFFNFVSALTAVLGFFVGVGIGTNSEEANSWILALAAGIFLYIALVDLLPELIHNKEKGKRRIILFVMVNIGFIISFVALLLLAIYEEDVETLVDFD